MAAPKAADIEVYDEIAGTPASPVTGLGYDDYLELFPDVDTTRRELIDGELVVARTPTTRHQGVVGDILLALHFYAETTGGKVFPPLTGVLLADDTMVQPDVLYVAAEHRDRIGDDLVRGAPDLVVEVSSPSTRRLDTVRKRALYGRFGVPEYWYVDLESDRIEVYRLERGGYGKPEVLMREDVLESSAAPGLSLAIDQLLGPSG